jgi:hypothetical protein
VTTEELRAAAETRRELGRDYDEAILLAVGGTFATIVGWICIAVINVVHARGR